MAVIPGTARTRIVAVFRRAIQIHATAGACRSLRLILRHACIRVGYALLCIQVASRPVGMIRWIAIT